MSNDRMIVISNIALFSLVLVGCTSKASSFSHNQTCERSMPCTISGTLSYQSTVFGAFFELDFLKEQQSLCVAREGVTIDALKRYAGKQISLSGRFEDFVEFPDCAYIKFGDSQLPCGYCGDKVFVATEITR